MGHTCRGQYPSELFPQQVAETGLGGSNEMNGLVSPSLGPPFPLASFCAGFWGRKMAPGAEAPHGNDMARDQEGWNLKALGH